MKLAVRSTGVHPWRRAHSLLAVAATVFATTALPAQVVFHVSLGQASASSVSGRLLVFAKPLGPTDKRPVETVNMDQIDTHATAIAAQEVAHLDPGARSLRIRPIGTVGGRGFRWTGTRPTRCMCTWAGRSR